MTGSPAPRLLYSLAEHINSFYTASTSSRHLTIEAAHTNL